MDYTSKIPVEIFHHIFSYLDGDEIFPCLGVSKRWRQIVNTDNIWRPLCSKARIFDPFPDSSGDLFNFKSLLKRNQTFFIYTNNFL